MSAFDRQPQSGYVTPPFRRTSPTALDHGVLHPSDSAASGGSIQKSTKPPVNSEPLPKDDSAWAALLRQRKGDLYAHEARALAERLSPTVSFKTRLAKALGDSVNAALAVEAMTELLNDMINDSAHANPASVVGSGAFLTALQQVHARVQA